MKVAIRSQSPDTIYRGRYVEAWNDYKDYVFRGYIVNEDYNHYRVLVTDTIKGTVTDPLVWVKKVNLKSVDEPKPIEKIKEAYKVRMPLKEKVKIGAYMVSYVCFAYALRNAVTGKGSLLLFSIGAISVVIGASFSNKRNVCPCCNGRVCQRGGY